MSFFHNPSTFCNANGGAKACGAQKHCRGVQATIESIEKIEMDVLPFSDLGFAVEEVQVFWFPMDSRNIMNVIRGRPHDSLSSSAHSRPHGASHFRPDGASDTKVSNKQQARTDMKSVVRVERDLKRQQGANRMCLLEHARPPDSIFSLNQWRWCHMGLILLASNTNESAAPTNSHGSGVLQRAEVIGRRNTRNGPHLYIVLDLYETGVRIDRLLVGWSSDNKEEKLKKLVLDHCGQREVYSAGISEPAQDSDVWTIRKHVKIFREWGYNPAFFNCQHFTSILFHRLTGKNLPKCLRHRWTSNRSLRGDNPNVVSSINARGISAAMRDSRLLKENLCIVDMDQLLFSYSPCIFDENNRAMASVGLGVSATGGLLAAAAASATDEAPASHDQRLILGSSIVALGATAASLGLGYDKIPRLCPLSRATIWFRYDPEKELGFGRLIGVVKWMSK